MKKFEYNLNSHAVYGSFDYGEVEAKDSTEALVLAREEIEKDVKEMNKLLEDKHSIDVDFDGLEVKEVIEPFDLAKSLTKMFNEFSGEDFDGMLFEIESTSGIVSLRFPKDILCSAEILCTPFWENVKGILFDCHNDNLEDLQIEVLCPKPTNHGEFAEFKEFYKNQLYTIQGRFARVDSVIVNTVDKTYIVEGFLIPKQVISYLDFSDWDSIVGYSGKPIVDCQIDLDEKLNFQYTDYNMDEEGNINLDDTPIFGGGYINRDYRSCDNVELVDELHPLTARLLDQFYIRYQDTNNDGDDETRIVLDRIVRDTLKNIS